MSIMVEGSKLVQQAVTQREQVIEALKKQRERMAQLAAIALSQTTSVYPENLTGTTFKSDRTG